MKYIDEYRDAEAVRLYADGLAKITTRPWTIMEICGGQTHAIVKFGIEKFLPEDITLVHGPGCPVCVTPIAMIDKAIALASMPGVTVASFGDMLRVPGSKKDLLTVKSEGGDVRILYSPLDAVKLAQRNPESNVVFFAVGFETTAPANAMAVTEARRLGLKNFSILCSHVLVPPAIRAILNSPFNTVQGFLAAGHVCTVMGFEEYVPLAAQFHVPIVITGFEPVDIMQGIYKTILQLENNTHIVENQYSRAVTKQGNIPAQQLLNNVFDVSDRAWRGIGSIPNSGLTLKDEFSFFDAERRFDISIEETKESEQCLAGQVLQGIKKPFHCNAFGVACTPEHPLGAPMVSSEGACAAYYRYSRNNSSM